MLVTLKILGLDFYRPEFCCGHECVAVVATARFLCRTTRRFRILFFQWRKSWRFAEQRQPGTTASERTRPRQRQRQWQTFHGGKWKPHRVFWLRESDQPERSGTGCRRPRSGTRTSYCSISKFSLIIRTKIFTEDSRQRTKVLEFCGTKRVGLLRYDRYYEG